MDKLGVDYLVGRALERIGEIMEKGGCLFIQTVHSSYIVIVLLNCINTYETMSLLIILTGLVVFSRFFQTTTASGATVSQFITYY